ncbi:hypothetical protein ABH930_006934 [Kitasatospora sp. GAS204A]|uniref:glycoprotein n=1 Tax=unclassified Kitasatospora TaxID=2633591 RepID=UPI0024751FDB|nr:glycoprotein [Kitasatospora sp. GAS204B]MDH6122657.1 hypothetical protein [Kitasatospora sp. GAS204B]
MTRRPRSAALPEWLGCEPDGTDQAGARLEPALSVPAPVRPYEELIAAARQARLTAAPANLPSEHEQAKFELGLVVALILDAPEAARGLDLLVNSRQIHPEGAEVFAALLYASERVDGAEFWWRFAAGSGSRISAYCLHLHHLRLGESGDADYWLAWSRDLAERARPTPPRPLRSSQPLLPEAVRRDILARCHRGLAPRLPAALEAVINQLPVRADDPDFGHVPRPDAFAIDGLEPRTGPARTAPAAPAPDAPALDAAELEAGELDAAELEAGDFEAAPSCRTRPPRPA